LFGVPEAIGGQFNMLAVDIFKQVIARQNFAMGTIVSVVLLIPVMFALFIGRVLFTFFPFGSFPLSLLPLDRYIQ